MQVETSKAEYTAKDYQYFKDKELRLQRSLNIVKERLQAFQNEADKIQGSWSDSDRMKLKDWNKWHDLQYRIEDRIYQNYSDYKDWHWDTFGFNTYP